MWIANPVWRLIQALSTMEDDQEHITVDGFFDDVRTPTQEDEELCEALGNSPDAGRELDAHQVMSFKWGLTGKQLYLHAQTQPQLNIDGIIAGYTLSLIHI